MYRILIVDDEILVRVGIKSYIPWTELGMELVGEASNGKEALELINRTKPHIVLLDIKMPVMSGIDVLCYIRENHLHTKVIVLSNYDDYDDVRKAMKLGAVDYLLKLSIGPSEIISLLKKTRNTILEDDAKNSEKLLPDNFIEKQFHLLMEKPDDPEVEEKIASQLGKSDYCVCNFFMVSDEAIDMNVAYNIVTQLNKDCNFVISFRNKANEIVSVLHNAPGKDRIGDYANMVVSTLKSYLNVNCRVGISDTFHRYGEFSLAYGQCLQCRQARFYMRYPKIAWYEEIKNMFTLQSATFLDAKTIDEIRFYVECNNISEAQKIIRQNISTLCDRKNVMPQLVKNQVINVANILLNNLDKITSDNSFLNHLFDYNNIADASDIFELEQIIANIFNKYETILARNAEQSQKSGAVIKAVGIIHHHYMDHLTLTAVANQVNISQAYLSVLFKRETGENFVDYLNSVRINEAKLLLLNSNATVSEIGYSVGFENMGYFSKTFRKYMGISPSEYKKSHLHTPCP